MNEPMKFEDGKVRLSEANFGELAKAVGGNVNELLAWLQEGVQSQTEATSMLAAEVQTLEHAVASLSVRLSELEATLNHPRAG
jgi:ubiquinone biosynthesis protein UbiJ